MLTSGRGRRQWGGNNYKWTEYPPGSRALLTQQTTAGKKVNREGRAKKKNN